MLNKLKFSTKEKFINYSEQLEKDYGYIKTIEKPYLLYYKYKSVMFFIDMNIEKWQIQDPIFYWKWFITNKDITIKQRSIFFEWNRLNNLSLKIYITDENIKQELKLIPNFDNYDIRNAKSILINTNQSLSSNNKENEKRNYITPIRMCDRVGICMHCGNKTNEWIIYNGGDNSCECNSCFYKVRNEENPYKNR